MHVIIVGAGLAGLMLGYELNAAGVEVTVLERAQGPALGASFGNGALLHPSYVQPWNSPGIFRFLLRNLGRDDSPMLLRAKAIPSLIGWGTLFVRHSTPARFSSNTLANLRLALFSMRCLEQVRDATKIDYGGYRRGTLAIFRDSALLSAALVASDALKIHGLESHRLDQAELVRIEPCLRLASQHIAGAIHFPNDEGGDSYRLCTGLAHYLVKQGATIRYGTQVLRLHRTGSRIDWVVDDHGNKLRADVFVLANGSESPILARQVGVRIPVRPVKGYSITLDSQSATVAPSVPVLDMDLHMAVVPLAQGRTRVAGTAEFTGFDLSVRPDRIRNLSRLLAQIYPDLAAADLPVEPWAGLRPMSADGVPIIGSTALDNLYVNTGHGPYGWTMAAGAARLAADAILSRQSELTPTPYRIQRFR